MNAITTLGCTALLAGTSMGLVGCLGGGDWFDARIRSRVWGIGGVLVVIAFVLLLVSGFVSPLTHQTAAQHRVAVGCYWMAGSLAAVAVVGAGLQQIGFRRDVEVAYASWVVRSIVVLLILAGWWVLCGVAAAPHVPTPVQVPGT